MSEIFRTIDPPEVDVDFLDAVEVSAAQQEFGVAVTKQAIGFDFNGGKGFSIPGLSVHTRDNSRTNTVSNPGVHNNGFNLK